MILAVNIKLSDWHPCRSGILPSGGRAVNARSGEVELCKRSEPFVMRVHGPQ